MKLLPLFLHILKCLTKFVLSVLIHTSWRRPLDHLYTLCSDMDSLFLLCWPIPTHWLHLNRRSHMAHACQGSLLLHSSNHFSILMPNLSLPLYVHFRPNPELQIARSEISNRLCMDRGPWSRFCDRILHSNLAFQIWSWLFSRLSQMKQVFRERGVWLTGESPKSSDERLSRRHL